MYLDKSRQEPMLSTGARLAKGTAPIPRIPAINILDDPTSRLRPITRKARLNLL